ncbi:MAG: MotA/TolQ/ExbB proton channel family protein [Verrucomicrobiota bacterium]|jgi:biopolymer transport protein ExbB
MHLTSRRVFRFTKLLCLAVLAIGLVTSAFAQEAPPAEDGGAKKEKSAFTMLWDVAMTPPYVFFLLIGCSIFTFTLIPERLMYYRKAGGNADEMVTKIKQAGTLSDALTAIEHAPGVAGRVLRAALTASRDGYTPEQVEQLVQGTVTKELISMEKFLPQLDSMVTLCPLIGLLGTTVGMIRSFSIIAAIGMSDPTKLAGGISEALINTASGLAVAIPALFAYNYFTGKKEAILMDMEKGLSEVMVILKQSAEG